MPIFYASALVFHLFHLIGHRHKGSTAEPRKEDNMRNTTAPVERTFSNDEHKMFFNLKNDICFAQRDAEGIAQRIAKDLWLIREKELYLIDDFKSITDYAVSVHGISKGTASDAINTYARFHDPDTKEIAARYSDYTFSTLMVMKKLTDEEIEASGIKPTMSRAKVQEAIKSYNKGISDKKTDSKTPEDDTARKYTTCVDALLKFDREHGTNEFYNTMTAAKKLLKVSAKTAYDELTLDQQTSMVTMLEKAVSGLSELESKLSTVEPDAPNPLDEEMETITVSGVEHVVDPDLYDSAQTAIEAGIPESEIAEILDTDECVADKAQAIDALVVNHVSGATTSNIEISLSALPDSKKDILKTVWEAIEMLRADGKGMVTITL